MTDDVKIAAQDNRRWITHCYVWGISCGHHDESCDGPLGHWSLCEQAERQGFAEMGCGGKHWLPQSPWPPEYETWLDRVDAARQQLTEGRARVYRSAARGARPANDSPIEQQFWQAHRRLRLPELDGLVAQHPVAGYRINFALPEQKIGIELDGFASHSSTADIEHDRRRQRILEANGWYIIRFGGREVHRDAGGCVKQAAYLVIHARKGEQQ